MNPYEKLNIPPDATLDEIKRAYHKAASKSHPDKGGDATDFNSIAIAYDILSDRLKRRQYDKDQKMPESENIEKEAAQMMLAAFNDVLNTKGLDVDVIKEARYRLREKLAGTPGKLLQIKKIKQKLDKLKSSLSLSGSPYPDIIGLSIEETITDVDLDREKVKHHHEVVKKALEMVKYYSYNPGYRHNVFSQMPSSLSALLESRP